MKLPRLQRLLSDKIMTIWFMWASVASIVTLIVGFALVWKTIARGDLAVDAVLGQQLSWPLAVLLAVLWIPPVTFAILGQWTLRQQPSSGRSRNQQL
jgi:hypothetical protein